MEYRYLGNSGLQISEIGLGTNNFGRRVDAAGTAKVMDQALEDGVTFIDTANVYSGGLSETYIGQAIKGKRDQYVLATKVAMKMGDEVNQSGASRQHILTEIENSLKRLQTDYVDLYQIHRADPNTPIEETLETLDQLVSQGKVRYIGCSNYQSWQICEALWTSRTRNLVPFSTVQPHYNMFNREIEKELVPFCKTYGIGILPYFPLANGFLTGKYRRGEAVPEGARLSENDRGMFSDRNFDILEDLEKFAKERDHTVLDVAFAWLLTNPCVSSVIAGATKPEQVTANAKTSGWQLTEEEMTEIDGILNQ
ncbi:MAG: aldo/keto reductase [Candidatus Latescibacteria bacterium]|nr:aldo/keto reductase [Candidatus Latescibacterota bacterium]MBT4138233.1 aldo/keto reductase [Candidatus Latescibacterota bacterium]